MYILPGQRASRDVRSVARVLHVTPSHVVVEVGLWDLLPGVHRHLTRQNPVRVTGHIQRAVEKQKSHLNKGKSQILLWSFFYFEGEWVFISFLCLCSTMSAHKESKDRDDNWTFSWYKVLTTHNRHLPPFSETRCPQQTLGCPWASWNVQKLWWCCFCIGENNKLNLWLVKVNITLM